MTETNRRLGTVGATRPPGAAGEREWAYRVTQGRFPADRGRPRLDRRGRIGRAERRASRSASLEVRGPWIAASYYRAGTGRGPVDPDKFPRRVAAHRRRRHDQPRTASSPSPNRSKDMIKSGGEWILLRSTWRTW